MLQERHGVSHHQQSIRLFNSLSRPMTKAPSKLRVAVPFQGESIGDRRIPLAKGQ